jgi:transketolase
LRDGRHVCLLGTGNIVPAALAAADQLAAAGLETAVVSLHTVKPLDKELLLRTFGTFRLVVTVEEHSILGGLGGAVAEWLSEQPDPHARLLRLGTPDRFLHAGGSEEYARQQCGIDAHSLAERILRRWQELPDSRVAG